MVSIVDRHLRSPLFVSMTKRQKLNIATCKLLCKSVKANTLRRCVEFFCGRHSNRSLEKYETYLDLDLPDCSALVSAFD